MKKKEFDAEEIMGNLRESEVLLDQGSTVGEVGSKLGITERTYLSCVNRKTQLMGSSEENTDGER